MDIFEKRFLSKQAEAALNILFGNSGITNSIIYPQRRSGTRLQEAKNHRKLRKHKRQITRESRRANR
jgi:hypothetical protein